MDPKHGTSSVKGGFQVSSNVMKGMAWTAALFLAVGAGLCFAPGKSTRRPNVILILTDDRGYGDVGVHGNDD